MQGDVRIENLEVECIIGVRDEERYRRQPVYFDCRISYRKLPREDEIEQAIDYSALAALLREVASEGKFRLLERLCESAAKRALEGFPVADRVEVTARKPQALGGAAVPSVTVRCDRS